MYSRKQIQCALFSATIATILNLILPQLVAKFATDTEIFPPNGAKQLSFKSQIIHMLVHHAQVPLSSSCIVFTIVFISVLLGYCVKAMLK